MSYAWFDIGDGRSVYRRIPTDEAKRSRLPCPMLSRDSMDPVTSPLDGKPYDSKSALRATYKAAGVIEMGNDAARLRPAPKPKPDRAAIRASLEKAKARVS